jgi:hypothetical protein
MLLVVNPLATVVLKRLQFVYMNISAGGASVIVTDSLLPMCDGSGANNFCLLIESGYGPGIIAITHSNGSCLSVSVVSNAPIYADASILLDGVDVTFVQLRSTNAINIQNSRIRELSVVALPLEIVNEAPPVLVELSSIGTNESITKIYSHKVTILDSTFMVCRLISIHVNYMGLIDVV